MICRITELGADPGDVVDRRRHTRHRLESGSSRLPEIVRGAHLIATEALKEWQLPVEEAGVWSVELVRRAEEEVGVERLHINGVVRCAADGVKDGQRANRMCRLHDPL